MIGVTKQTTKFFYSVFCQKTQCVLVCTEQVKCEIFQKQLTEQTRKLRLVNWTVLCDVVVFVNVSAESYDAVLPFRALYAPVCQPCMLQT